MNEDQAMRTTAAIAFKIARGAYRLRIDDAEDVAAMVVEKAWGAGKLGHEGFVAICARNACRDWLELKRNRDVQANGWTLEKIADQSRWAERVEERADYNALMDKMAETHWHEALHLGAKAEGLTDKEAAELLGETVEGFKSTLLRARARVRQGGMR